ncbi:MAG: nucleoside-diphosphate sugar epimerase [Daejeonella sp.]
MSRKAILIGASGLIGSNLLQVILDGSYYSDVLTLSRSELQITHPKLVKKIINFDDTSSFENLIYGDAIFSCLGTTKGETPDNSEYKKIDHDYPLQFAELGIKNGVNQFHIVSSLGADENSSNNYLKLKGTLEKSLISLNIKSLHIYQPSFLTGDRKENRLMEKLLAPLIKLINPLLIGKLKNYRSIKALDVAKAMYNQSTKEMEGTFIYPSEQIKKLV